MKISQRHQPKNYQICMSIVVLWRFVFQRRFYYLHKGPTCYPYHQTRVITGKFYCSVQAGMFNQVHNYPSTCSGSRPPPSNSCPKQFKLHMQHATLQTVQSVQKQREIGNNNIQAMASLRAQTEMIINNKMKEATATCAHDNMTSFVVNVFSKLLFLNCDNQDFNPVVVLSLSFSTTKVLKKQSKNRKKTRNKAKIKEWSAEKMTS